MDSLADEFVAWTMTTERTLDEAFLAEILIEEGLSRWKAREKIDDPMRYNWQAKREHYRRRRLNPAHRRIWSEIDVKRAAEFVAVFEKFDHWTHGEDRPVRDLSALRFCPKMKDLHLAPTELENLDGLAYVPELEHLWLQDDIIENLSSLRLCPKMKTLHLWLQYPWCDLRALAELPELEQITLHGNLPMLENVEPLQKVTKVLFNGWGNARAPIRDGHSLPDMPSLREAEISPIAKLAGVEKFSMLEEVIFEGPYKSIEPLAALGEVRKLVLGGERYHDISPVARMAKLGVLRLAREFPIDYAPLLESESLRELQRCDTNPLTPEQAGINAALGGWDRECVLTEPRPLPRPVYRYIQHRGNPPPGFASPEGTRAEPVSPPIAEAEGKWLAARLDRAMIRAFGRDWGETYSSTHDAARGTVDVKIHSIEIADRLPDVIELLRRELAWLRDGWVVDLTTDILCQWQRDPEEWKDDIQRDLDERIQNAKDHAERRRDYLAFLDRLQVYRLRQEQGEEPLPEEFDAPPEKEETPDSDLLEPPEDGIDDSWRQEHHPKWHQYYALFRVCEEGVWIPLGFQGTAGRLLLQTIEKFPGWTEEDNRA
jgi:hypothetical protein